MSSNGNGKSFQGRRAIQEDSAHGILLVEDEPAVRKVTRMILERGGYRVFSASNGVEALEKWKEIEDGVELLITDMVMPQGISGRRLAESLLLRNPDLKVIFSSGYSNEIVLPGPADSGKAVFLQKPYSAGELLEVVRNCLNEPSNGSLQPLGNGRSLNGHA